MEQGWIPPGRNCGACGYGTCEEFLDVVRLGYRKKEECPFFSTSITMKYCTECTDSRPDAIDILGNSFDFILFPLPGECSARKIILPFRPDIVERWDIKPGDILTGRPMGAGCPVQHVLTVLSASYVSGVIITHVVGPVFSRGKEVKDLEAYHVIGFEGLAEIVRDEPVIGKRMKFLPAYCMMNLGHTGVVNQIISRKEKLQVRVEDIRIL
ncbi:MAG: Fe-S cluster protein [Methanomicrobiales archaeon]|nr:Fe-S cluster protein [Methanomicrobiales archaeon]